MASGLLSWLPWFRPQNSIGNWPDDDDVGPRRAGVRVNGASALTFSGCWAATNAIAGLFGTLPCKLYRKTDAGREEAESHSLSALLAAEPNGDMDSFIFWEMMTQWWVNYGNAFAEIQRRKESGQIVALWPIHPSRVRPEKGNDQEWTGRWLVRNNSGSDSVFDASELLNIVGALSDDGIVGKGVISYAATTIGTALAEQGYRGEFYANGGRPSGVLEHPQKLSDTARDNLRREWRTVHGRSNEVAILWEGMKFNPVTVSPEHAEIINSSVFSIQEIARFYDLPPHVLYELSHGTFANVEEMNRFLVTHSYNRRIVRVEKAIQRQLLSEAEKRQKHFIKFNVDAFLRGNPKEQAEILEIEFRNGVTSADEWRALKDRNKLPDNGDVYWVRRDMAPTKLVIESAKKSVEETTPIVPTPETPPTPPAVSNRWKAVARKYRSRAGELSENVATLEAALVDRESRIETATATIATVTQERDAEIAAHTETQGKVKVAYQAVDHFTGLYESEKSLRESVQNEAIKAAEQHAAELLAITGERDAIAEAVATTTAERDSAQADVVKLTASAAHDAAAYLEACGQRDSLQSRLDTATKSLAEAENAVHTLQNEQTQAATAHAEAMAAENRRFDTLKEKADSLAMEVGALRAECDGLKAQRTALDGERQKHASDVTELRIELQKAAETSAQARKDAENAEKQAETRLSEAKSSVVASVRTLLDELLDSLLWKERERVRDCAKSYERFKELVNEFYLTFQNELAAHLAKASAACEAVGTSRVDTAKIAADYVAESRKRLNIAFNGANKAEIRSVIRQEVEGWDRKGELTNWIGE